MLDIKTGKDVKTLKDVQLLVTSEILGALYPMRLDAFVNRVLDKLIVDYQICSAEELRNIVAETLSALTKCGLVYVEGSTYISKIGTEFKYIGKEVK